MVYKQSLFCYNNKAGLCLFSASKEAKKTKGRCTHEKYEIMYIVNASLDDAAFKTVSDRLHATITENGGSIDKVDDWGVKEFAYEIDHMKKGHYVVINVTANNAGVFEFNVCLVSATMLFVLWL